MAAKADGSDGAWRCGDDDRSGRLLRRLGLMAWGLLAGRWRAAGGLLAWGLMAWELLQTREAMKWVVDERRWRRGELEAGWAEGLAG